MGEMPELIPKINDGGAHFRRLPLPQKILVVATIVIAVIWASVIMPMSASRNRKNFYNQEINSVVIDVSSTDGRRFAQYKLRNGLYIDFFYYSKNQLNLGDSIVKVPGTFKYKVYRKDIMEDYRFLGDFDFTVLK